MVDQKHIIKRQLVELTVSSASVARELEQTLTHACRHHLPSIVDKLCSQLTADDEVTRIERLELDLGELALDQFEAEFGQRFAAELERQLRDAKRRATPVSPLETSQDSVGRSARSSGAELHVRSPEPSADTRELELLGYFLETGVLPWWTDRLDVGRLDVSIERSVDRTPRALGVLLRSVLRRKSHLRRLVRSINDESLALILELLSTDWRPAPRGLVEALTTVLPQTRVGERLSARQLRELLWSSVLPAVLKNQQAAVAHDVRRLAAAILAEVADELEVEREALLDDVGGAMAKLTPQSRASISGSLATLEAISARGSNGERSITSEDQERSTGKRTDEERRLTSTETGGAETNGDISEAGLSHLRSLESPPDADDVEAPDYSFSDIDEIYVDNAGLVILAPFLGYFLDRLGLLADKRFTSDVARHRGVGLLQHVVTQDPAPAEYLLPLSKVLCGMPLEEVFDFGEQVTEEESEECDQLLTAVIAQAPILKNMSLAGFRGSFLLRQGRLSARDDAWLLQVERQTYDLVLDRFPWSFGWVKLPWMETPLRVEW